MVPYVFGDAEKVARSGSMIITELETEQLRSISRSVLGHPAACRRSLTMFLYLNSRNPSRKARSRLARKRSDPMI